MQAQLLTTLRPMQTLPPTTMIPQVLPTAQVAPAPTGVVPPSTSNVMAQQGSIKLQMPPQHMFPQQLQKPATQHWSFGTQTQQLQKSVTTNTAHATSSVSKTDTFTSSASAIEALRRTAIQNNLRRVEASAELEMKVC